MKTFKERWNEEDERCSQCNSITKKVLGINKQNLKRLFSKPTLQDAIVFIMLVACLFLTWAYYTDVSQYKAILQNPDEFCTVYQNKVILDNQKNINIQPIESDNLNLNLYDNGK